MLNSREVTEAMRKANRANAQKSTGPRTEQGKHNSRGNAFRHGIFGNKLCPWGEALDEDSVDYQRFCGRYREALQPRDAFEALLAADMARTQWRLERVLHAEAAGLAWQRAKFDNEHRRKEAGEGVGIRAGFEQIASHKGGYGALPESEGKYELILFILRTLLTEAQTDGYTETGVQCLRVLYGPQPGVAKQVFFIDEYNALQPRPECPPEMQEYQRQQFLGKLQEEISNFQTQRDCLRTERSTLFDMERDSLLLGEKAAKIVAGEETRLRNYLQQTFKQLMAWREKRGQEGPGGSAASSQPCDPPGSPSNGRPGAERRGGDDAPAARPGRPRHPVGAAPRGRPQPREPQVPTAQAGQRAPAGLGAQDLSSGRQTMSVNLRTSAPYEAVLAASSCGPRREPWDGKTLRMVEAPAGATLAGLMPALPGLKDAAAHVPIPTACPAGHRRAPAARASRCSRAVRLAPMGRQPQLSPWAKLCRSFEVEFSLHYAGRPRLPERLRPGG
jgi:hypothetical protein